MGKFTQILVIMLFPVQNWCVYHMTFAYDLSFGIILVIIPFQINPPEIHWDKGIGVFPSMGQFEP